jgi:hypothetical protein
MLTKEAAIARLRATGTLGNAHPAAHIIPGPVAKEPLMRTVCSLVQGNSRTRGSRMVAPGLNQSVLP